MGVHGTFCQLCGLPTQHDHYVRTATALLKIYRGAQAGGGHQWEPGEAPFAFGPEHAWLTDAVVLPWDEARVLRGRIEDGVIVDGPHRQVMVFDGGDEGLAYHHACWVLQGRPPSSLPAIRSNGSHGWAMVESSHGQLFDFAALAEDGKRWMLADPTVDLRSRARIEAMMEASREDVGDDEEPSLNLARLLKLDRDWRATTRFDTHGARRAIIRARLFSIRRAEKGDYGTLLRVTLPTEGPGLPSGERFAEIEALEVALKACVERGAAGCLAAVRIGGAGTEFLSYVRDAFALKAQVEALPGGAAVETSNDPTWAEAARLVQSVE